LFQPMHATFLEAFHSLQDHLWFEDSL
jgi:hypothetical protein